MREADPLANLPRPLSERPSARRGPGRRILGVLAAGVLGAGAFALASSLSNGPLAPVVEVQGAIATVGPGGIAGQPPSAAPTGPAALIPTAVPTATTPPMPTPVPTPAAPASLTGYQWPLPRGRLTLPFGPSPWGSRIVDGEKFHDGMDLATFCGDRIVAAHAGTVLAAGRRYDQWMGWVGDLKPYLDRLDKKHLYGTLPIMVVIDDGNGYRSMYAHFRKVKVKKGQVVKAGQLLGWEGDTGRASGCHLHYGIFSPLETATFGIDKGVVKRMKVPDQQIARIDPMLVLGERPKMTRPPAASPGPTPTPAP